MTTWKVGQVAEASGLTVRTLHHWDAIGLLNPSCRTAGGHRAYEEKDLVRLYQILALRRLGLGLESITTCLDVGVDPVRLIGDHEASVAKSIVELESLRRRLAGISERLSSGEEPSTVTLLDLLGSMGGPGPDASDALSGYLDQDQLRVLEIRAESVGQMGHYLLEIEWPELSRRAEVLRQAGAEPGSAEVRRLVKRMDELAAMFNGGDAEISREVRRAWHDDPGAMSGDLDVPADDWRDLSTFLDESRSGTTSGQERP